MCCCTLYFLSVPLHLGGGWIDRLLNNNGSAEQIRIDNYEPVFINGIEPVVLLWLTHNVFQYVITAELESITAATMSCLQKNKIVCLSNFEVSNHGVT